MVQKRFLVIVFLIAVLTFARAHAQKFKLGTGVKLSAPYYLTMIAAEEKGIWKKNGLDVEWVPFKGGGPFSQALAVGEIKMGFQAASGAFTAAARGSPVIIVSDLAKNPFFFWVRGNSRFRQAADIKGAKIGVSSLASAPSAQGRIVAKALGLEKEVRFVGVGDLTTAMAGLKTGVIDAAIYGFDQMAELKYRGEVRDLIKNSDYLPREWVDLSIQARKDFLKEDAPLARRLVKACFQAVEFVTKERGWSVATIKATVGFSEGTAELIYDYVTPLFTKDGKINLKALDNVRNFLIEYRLVPKEKVPTSQEIYTPELLS